MMTDSSTAISDVVSDHYARALRFLRGLVGEPDCYDLAQESVAAFLQRDAATIRNPKAYFWGIVRNQRKKHFAARSSLLSALGVYELLSADTIATRLSTKLARRDDFDAALQSVPIRLQEVFDLRFIEDLSLAECAEAMECSEATIKRDLDAARTALAKALGCDEDAVVRDYVKRP